MPFTFTMPKLSPTMQEGVIAKWHKKEGDFVESGDLLLEVATDKATVEYNALDKGYVRKILKNERDKAAVNEALAIFTEKQNENIEGYEPEGVKAQEIVKQEIMKPAAAAPLKSDVMQKPLKAASISVPIAANMTAPAATALPKQTSEKRVLASPLAKNQARLQSLDLSSVQGTGPHGRIMSRDLAQAASVSHTVPSLRQADGHESLTPMRKVIADRLQYSKSTIPHFYIQQNIDVERLVKLREEVKRDEKNLTINDFIIKAVAIALRMHGAVNSGYDPDNGHIIRYANVDIAIAVTIQGGLITPILHNADTLSISSISEKVKTLAVKAKDGRLSPEEYQGGSFTISNLGMFGVTSFQAIVNPPQGAILAVGAIQEVPVVKNGAVVPGKVVSLTLSCDHRVIDGAEAAQFMRSLKKLIENPPLFLTE